MGFVDLFFAYFAVGEMIGLVASSQAAPQWCLVPHVHVCGGNKGPTYLKPLHPPILSTLTEAISVQ